MPILDGEVAERDGRFVVKDGEVEGVEEEEERVRLVVEETRRTKKRWFAIGLGQWGRNGIWVRKKFECVGNDSVA